MAESSAEPTGTTPVDNAPQDEGTSKAPENPAPTTDKDSDAGIVLHHLNNSRSKRILWLLEELGLPYSIKKYTYNEEMRAPQALKDIHPLGKAPILTDGNVTIAESGAIIEYLITKYGDKFLPTESGKIDNIYFSHYAEGSLMPIIINQLIFVLIPQRSPIFIRPLLRPVFATVNKKFLEPELKAHCALIESHLEKSETGWLAGGDHPTSADFMMFYPAEILIARSQFVGPKTKEYVARIHKRDAFKHAIEKGGDLEYPRF